MTILKATSAALVAAALTFPAASAHAASSPKGVWMNDTGRGAIEIKSCGDALCGHVVWVKATGDEKGCGKQIIGEARPAGSGHWDNGWIYSPEKKRRYDVELTPLSESRLRVVGYAGTKFFSKTMIWTKAPDDLQRCGTKTTTTVEANAAAVPAPVMAAPAKSEAKPAATAALEAKPNSTAAKDAAKPAPNVPVTLLNAPALPQPAKVAAVPAKPASSGAKPVTTAAAPPAASPPNPVPQPGPQDKAASQPPEPAPGAADTANSDTASSDSESSETASADDDDPANAPKAEGGLNLGNLKLGDLDLDKVLTRSGDGKCKLKLPFIKVHFDCNQ